jgi:predicted DNA-binding transcriptional regulator AlpA
MSGSPALKIVRNGKPPSNAQNVPRCQRGGYSTTKPRDTGDGSRPCTMTDVEVARELRVSAKTIRRMHTAGKLPRPLLIGSRSFRWLRQTLVEWLALGCPDRDAFEANRKGGE